METLTLLRTFPTLCRTLVATSAMPACREASINCLCSFSSCPSDLLRSVMSSTVSTITLEASSLATGAMDASTWIISPCFVRHFVSTVPMLCSRICR